jgi:hypothetical protein
VVEAPAWEKRRERFEGERKPIGDLGIEVDKNGKKKIILCNFFNSIYTWHDFIGPTNTWVRVF